jgi:hypothetical protein
MELKFTEIENLDKKRFENFEVNSNKSSEITQPKYWEQTKKTQNTQPTQTLQKKKKVTFDDILSNMNLTVNQNGVLQSMTPLPQYEEELYYQEQSDQYNNLHQNQIQSQNKRVVQKNNEPLDPNVKHSYIFNKYFKDYKDANDNFKPQPRVPKTIEEYKQMVLEERIKQIQERNRIAQIKSTKMMFISNPNVPQNRNSGVIRASKNNLRSMNFK